MTEPMDRLEAYRRSLDELDRELIALLGRRFQIIRDVANLKKETGIAVMQSGRVHDVYATRMAHARKAGLNEKLVERVWAQIMSQACQTENDVGGIEGGELLFQGTGIDHALVRVQDLEGALEQLCEFASFEILTPPAGPAGRRVAVLRGGEVTLVLEEGWASSEAPAYLAVSVHSVEAAMGELRKRGAEPRLREDDKAGVRMASVSLGQPCWLQIAYVECPPRTTVTPSLFDPASEGIATDERCSSD